MTVKSMTWSNGTGFDTMPTRRYRKYAVFQVRSKFAGLFALTKNSRFSAQLVEWASPSIESASVAGIEYPVAISCAASCLAVCVFNASISSKMPRTRPSMMSGWSLAKSARANQTSAISLLAVCVETSSRLPRTFDIIEGLVRGIFDAMEALKTQTAKQEAAQLMATGYSIPATDALSMLGDAHSTNWAENREFFVNANNPANFERTWNTAYFLYRRVGMVSNPVPFDQVMDFTVIKKLGGEPRYANQRNEYQVQFVPTTATSVQAENTEILTKTVVIHFFPNSWDLHKKVISQVNGQDRETPYDPNVDFVVDEIGRLAGQYGAARIVIEGHTDASMKGQIDPTAVKELSTQRANAVKEAVLRRFRTLQPNQFLASGMGWDKPADPTDPMNNAKNRRVEVKVYPLEATH